MLKMKGYTSHLVTTALSVGLSIGYIHVSQPSVAQVNPKQLIDSFKDELDKTEYNVQKQTDMLVKFSQVLEKTMTAYADDNNVTLLVGAAVASNENDVTNEIAELVIEQYKQQGGM